MISQSISYSFIHYKRCYIILYLFSIYWILSLI
nr:MAG TPA: hypothetical protein [Crassvirales sp.]DAX04513.1 MAG TPA: hypothetical protein [Bacteriophage sp.]